MSVTVAAIAKKVSVYLAADKRTWKATGLIIAINSNCIASGNALAGNGQSVVVCGNAEHRLFRLRAESICPAARRSFLRWNRTEQQLRLN